MSNMQFTTLAGPDNKKLLKHAATTGVAVGAISYFFVSIYEGKFVAPAVSATISSGLVNYMMPVTTPVHRAILTGAGMAAICMFVTKDCPPEGAIKYGVLAAGAAYVASEYIVPRLMTYERQFF